MYGFKEAPEVTVTFIRPPLHMKEQLEEFFGYFLLLTHSTQMTKLLNKTQISHHT